MIPSKEVSFAVTNYLFLAVVQSGFLCEQCKVKGDKKFACKQSKCDCFQDYSISVRDQQHPETELGYVDISNMEYNQYETHSEIDPSIREIGMGLYLYALAADFCANHKLKLSSSDDPSKKARRVWKSKRLRKYYHVRKVGKVWIIKPRASTKLSDL